MLPSNQVGAHRAPERFSPPSLQVDKYLVMNADSDSYRSARRKALEVCPGLRECLAQLKLLSRSAAASLLFLL